MHRFPIVGRSISRRPWEETPRTSASQDPRDTLSRINMFNPGRMLRARVKRLRLQYPRLRRTCGFNDHGTRSLDAPGEIGVVCTAPIVPEQPGHQHGLPEIKFWMACHFGGALPSGLVVCMIDSMAPQEPYLLPAPTSA